MVLILIGTIYSWNETNKQKEVFKSNQETLLNSVRFYKTADSLSVASVGELKLSESQLKAHNEDLIKTLASLNIKVKRLTEASKTASETILQLKTSLRDTTVIVNNYPVLAKTFTWNDAWVNVNGLITDSTEVQCNIAIQDTLVQIVHRIPKQWWFFKWGTKSLQQEVTTKNPHTKIVYTEYIKVE